MGALETATLATEPTDRFYAALDLAGVYQNLVASCDYRPIEDARSRDDDPYGACRRAADAGERTYCRCGDAGRCAGLVFYRQPFARHDAVASIAPLDVGLARTRADLAHAWAYSSPSKREMCWSIRTSSAKAALDAEMALFAQVAEQAAASAGSNSVLAFGLRGDAAAGERRCSGRLALLPAGS